MKTEEKRNGDQRPELATASGSVVWRGDHATPINRVAARLLRKAPWWAQYPEPAKEAIQSVKADYSIEEWVDITKAPPGDVEDKRGVRIEWPNGARGVIVGYAHWTEGKHSGKAGKPRYWKDYNEWDPMRRKGAIRRVHSWWVESNGELRTMKWRTGRRWKIIGQNHYGYRRQ